MIVPMQRIALLCLAAESGRALETLRDLQCVQLDCACAPSAASATAQGDLEAAVQAVRLVEKTRKDLSAAAGTPQRRTVAEVQALAASLAEQETLAEALRVTERQYAPWGDFDPALVRRLQAEGVDLSSVCELPDPLPKERLGETRRRLAEALSRVASVRADLAATDVTWITSQYPALRDRLAFEQARDALATQGTISWIEGWVPRDAVPKVRARAVTSGWGLSLRDPAPDETPPTLIRPPKLFRPVAALFAGLGIAPAYVETDVSVPFMCYFSLFFAMLVGDGAYGAIFLALTLVGWRKTKPAEGAGHRPRAVRSWLALMTVFSSATILWGLLSNTWFGAGIPWCASWPTVKWLADPSYNNMMLLCFTIGVSHLMLARLWNALSKLNDTTCLAEFGWAGILLTMYLVTNAIVGIFPAFPSWAYWVGGVSAALVFGFTVKPCELKTRGVELGMLPLNIMSALGDIISYVRLFAVGLASVKVAENFNGMALGFVQGEHAWWATALGALATVAILLVGHGLNLAMAGLSILVHAVRLNTLEFSNHKGVSWAGYAFSPFKKV